MFSRGALCCPRCNHSFRDTHSRIPAYLALAVTWLTLWVAVPVVLCSGMAFAGGGAVLMFLGAFALGPVHEAAAYEPRCPKCRCYVSTS